MSKSRHQKNNASNKLLLVLVIWAAVVVLILAGMLLMRGRGGSAAAQPSNPAAETSASDAAQLSGNEGAQGEAQQNATEPTAARSEVPCVLEDGKLELKSVFPFTGINVDCGWQEGTNIGTVELTNVSDQHLVQAEVQLTMSDGTVLEFVIRELPAGETVWAFDINNASYSDAAYCTSVTCTAEFEDATQVMEGIAEVTVNGMDISITNRGSETLENLQITCHSVLDGICFGGTVFTYSATSIAPGGSANVLAAECFLDTAAVVRITANE